MNKDIRHLDLNADIILLRGKDVKIVTSRSLWERGRPARGLCAAPVRKANPRTKVTSALPLS